MSQLSPGPIPPREDRKHDKPNQIDGGTYQEGDIVRATIYAVVVALFFVIAVCLIRRTAARERRRGEEEAERTLAERKKSISELRSELRSHFDANNLTATLERQHFIHQDTHEDGEAGDVASPQQDEEDSKDSASDKSNISELVQAIVDNDEPRDLELGEANEGIIHLANQKTFPNTCAICLDTYQVGSVIAWSSEEYCGHAFHRECIVRYLAYKKKKSDEDSNGAIQNTSGADNGANRGGHTCPCCRQPFVVEARSASGAGEEERSSGPTSVCSRE